MSSEHINAGWNGKSVQEVSKPKRGLDTFKRHPKTDLRYWQQAVYLPTYTKDGEQRTAGEYAVKVQQRGRRETFSLGTANKEAAAGKAKQIYLSLQADGWDQTLRKFKPKSDKTVTTVGEFLAEVKAKASGRPRTINGYCQAFRTIVVGILGIDGGKEKYDYQGGGHDRWLTKIHAIRLEKITPDKVQKWKLDFVKRAAGDPVKERAARISVNSTLRQAKSLFAPGVLKFIRLDLPGSLPFDGVEFEPRQSMRYRSDFDVRQIIQLAINGEPEKENPPLPEEQRKIFLLAVMAGLRRNEIDKLEWAAFRWDEGVIRIENTKYIRLKSEDSAGDVEIDPELLAVFRGFHAKDKEGFVVKSQVAPRPNSTYAHYRCQKDFEALTKWLRAKGVTGNHPLHTLRKEFGSQMCAKHGIYAASHALRHGDIAITSQHYLDSRKRATVGLGGLLASGTDVITQFPAPDQEKTPSQNVPIQKAR